MSDSIRYAGRSFTMLPDDIFRCGLRPVDIAVYAALMSLTYERQVTVSHKALAEMVGASPSTVQEAIGTLRERSIIEVTHRHEDGRGQTSNLYTLHDFTPRNTE